MTALTYIQGGPGWRRTWKRTLGEGPGGGAITVLNGHARDYGVRDPEGAFSIKWAARGRIAYRVDGFSHVLQGGRMVLLNTAQPYELEFLDRAGAESLCVFISDDMVAQAWRDLSRPDLVDEGPADGRVPQFPDLVFQPDPEVAVALARLRDSYGEDDPSAMALEERLLELAARLVAAAQGHRRLTARIPAVKASTRKLLAARLQRARELIEESDEEPSLDALARESALSKFHLLRLFKAAFGCTPSAYGRARRMARGKGLLRAGSMSVAEIGQALGYENASAFVRAFRRHFGVTPSAIRV